MSSAWSSKAVAPTRRREPGLRSGPVDAAAHRVPTARISTAGEHRPFPFSPSDLDMGAVHRFSLHHLLTVSKPLELFPIRVEQVGVPRDRSASGRDRRRHTWQERPDPMS